MKTSKIKTEQGVLRFAACIALLVSFTSSGQNNSSYDANTVPISGNDCAAFGPGALSSNNGNDNTAVGVDALLSNTNANSNTALGANALRLSDAPFNTAVGATALTANTSGAGNTATGGQALLANQTGDNNTAAGLAALSFNDADENSAFGANCMVTNTSGTRNTGLGIDADVSAGNLTNATAIGAGAIVNLSNKIRVGDANVTVCEAPVGWTSDGRFKFNISESDVKGLDFIMRLRPVVYNFDTRKFIEFLTQDMSEEAKNNHLKKDFTASTAVRQTGFIAQEVEQAALDARYNFSGVYKPKTDLDNYALGYAHFVVPMVKAMQEQQRMLEELQAELQSIKEKQSGATGISENGGFAGFEMGQNVPNPFTNETVINYTVLPSDVIDATMFVYDLSGKQIKIFQLDKKAGAITITAENLAAGIYIYTIVADGIALDSKRMIITAK